MGILPGELWVNSRREDLKKVRKEKGMARAKALQLNGKWEQKGEKPLRVLSRG